MNRPIRLLCGSLVLAAAGVAQIPFTLTDSNLTYTQSSVATNTTSTAGLANMVVSAGQDNLYQHWWYYRVNGDTREFAFNNSAANGFVSAPAGTGAQTMSWADVEGRNLFSAVQTIVVTSDGATQGHTWSTMTLTNLTSTAIDVDLFAYGDYDVCATAGTDTATVTATEHLITDACGRQCRFGGVGATNTEVGAFATIRGRLLDAALIALAGVGTGTFGPGDYTGVFQWTLTIPANGSVSAVSYFSEGIETLPSYDTYGTEGAGGLGIPTISRVGHAVQDANATVTFSADLANGAPNSAAFHLLSLGRGSAVVAGIGINVNLGAMLTTFKLTSATGTATFPFAIPATPDFRGLQLNHQYIVADGGAANGLASWTKGLETILGHY